MSEEMRKICLVIGDPVHHSLSPIMHNAGYCELGLEEKFVYASARVLSSDLQDALKGIKALGILGVSCTVPHKVALLELLDKVDPLAQKIGAVNTVVNRGGELIGYNTDWLGVVQPIRKLTDLRGKKTAVLGAGGTARAAAFGLKQSGAEVTIFNRTLSKAQSLADECGAYCGPLETESLSEFEVVVNTTTVGMHPIGDASPVGIESFSKGQIVLDAVYNPVKTTFLRLAEEKGAHIILGLEMLLYQGAEQFRLFTGREAPIDAMRSALAKEVQRREEK